MGSPDLFSASCERLDMRRGETVGLIRTVRSTRVLTRWGLLLLAVLSPSPEAPTNYAQHRAGPGSGEGHLQHSSGKLCFG